MSYAIFFMVVFQIGIHVFEDVLWAKILFMIAAGIALGILRCKERRLKERITSLESDSIFTKDQMLSFQSKNNTIFEKIVDILQKR